MARGIGHRSEDVGRTDMAVTHLGALERQRAILELLERESAVRVDQLAQAFGVSRVTARADLDALARDGKLRRTHGGAASLSRRLTVSVQDRRVNVNAKAKQVIAARAAQLVGDGDTLLVDSGTTTLELVRALSLREGLTVVTADLTIAEHIDRAMPSCDVVMLGGMLRKAHRYTTGPLAMAALAELHADKVFVCPSSFVPGRGLMTDYQAMAELKRAMLGAADRRYCLMDASKVGASGLIRFAGLVDFDAVVMDVDPEGVVAAALKGSGTRLMLE